MSFPGSNYAPPGTYTRTLYADPTQPLLTGLKIPLFLGTGSEILTQNDLEMIRGSSSMVDQRVVQEDETGRAVVSISDTGLVTLGAFNGVLDRIQVRNFPIVTGQGTGTTATNTSAVSVTINGSPIVVLRITGATGVLKLSTPPELGDDVRVTYYFNRTDTQITDDVSDQITPTAAIIRGVVGQTYEIVTGVNDGLSITVDDATTVAVTLPASGLGTPWTASQLVSFINAAASGTSLVASAYTTNEGTIAIALTADRNVTIGSGTANSTLGFTNGDASNRNNVFYTFQGAIVDGTNGGITTTDPSDVVAKVDGVQVIPTAVNGATRAVTLPFAPEIGAVVTIQYYFNSWQDTFDYLAHTGVTNILRCGATPDRTDYTDEADFILKDDRILWGASFLVVSGAHTSGTAFFDDTQIFPTLVDAQQYLAECVPVTNTSVSPPVTSTTEFILPLAPTTGNGRNTPLGSSLFQTITNSRIDLPTDRPDLVVVYWGFGIQDAIDRGAVTVTKVNSATSTITLEKPVEVGASVYATFYYNTLSDQEYTLTVATPGGAGVGTYTIMDEDGETLLTPAWGSKSAGLAGITVQFPSGSERTPDLRFETPFTTTSFTGAVEEDVTVTFMTRDGTPAKMSIPGADPYYMIPGASDRFDLEIDGAGLAGGWITLSQVNGVANLGFVGSMLGDEASYDASSGYTTYTVDATNNELNITVDGVLLSATATPATTTLAAYETALNTAALATAPEYAAATRFTSAITITLNEYDTLNYNYNGATAGATGSRPITVTAAAYATPALLAAAIQAAFVADILLVVAGDANFAGLAVAVTANASGQLVFALTKATGDACGYIEFITDGTPAEDFAILAGVDTAGVSGAQTKLIDGPVARRYTLVGDQTGALLWDRLILRNRLVPGSGSLAPFHALDQAYVQVGGGSGAAQAGLTVNQRINAGWQATVTPATLLGVVGFAGGQATGSQPSVTFFATGGTTAQNNVFKFTFDNVPITVEFTDSAGVAIPTAGTADVPLGPAGTANTVLNQIAAAMATAGFGASAAAVISARLIFQEGAGIRLVSSLTSTVSSIVIGNGSANTLLGFAEGTASTRSPVEAGVLASALMAHSFALLPSVYNSWTSPVAASTYFAGDGLAGVLQDDSNAEYLYIQSQANSGIGASSSLTIDDAGTASVLLPGTDLGLEDGDGSVGEVGISGYYVISSDPVDGSGTANTSLLNSGTGQDGVVGQTYRDLVTGLTFTILGREGGSNYPTSTSLTFNVRASVTTDSNLPINTLPGTSLIVTNTLSIGAGDTAVVATYERGGSEPSIGDTYYVSYEYSKQDFATRVYTKFAAIQAEYGENSPDNPVTLASYLAILNGAVLIGIKQVEKDIDEDNNGVYDGASVTAFISAVDDVAGALSPGVLPTILVPLDVPSADTVTFLEYIARHADIQSTIRYRAERTVLAGFPAGTMPRSAGDTAQAIARGRLRLVYPDIASLSLTQADGTEQDFIIDGSYLASMLAGSVVAPSVDVATPWTNRKLFGVRQLSRVLDAVAQNQAAVRGLTILDDLGNSILKVRHGLTTDMSNVLTKTPTVIQIADEVQQQSRGTLDRFVGIKFLPGILSQIEGQLSTTLRHLVDAEVLRAYTGVRANTAADDPTVAEVEAYYQPIFPLLYLIATFNLRASL